MKYIITESQNDNLKVLLKQVIKSKGVLTTIKSVGGFDNFVKIMDVDSPRDFLNLFNDLDAVQSGEDPDWTLFRFKPEHNLMIYNRRRDLVYINRYEIWEILKDIFVLIDFEVFKLIKEWLGEVYNIWGVTPFDVSI